MAPTTHPPAVLRVPSRETTTSRQRSPGGTPVTAACTRTQAAAGTTCTVIRVPVPRSVADATRVWAFTLKEGVKYEDGSPVKAQDIKYNVERSFAPD
ncbi:ABC transporter substrate-binding protein, partial [Streptomyces sp. NPDC051130]|uniref:ABC transporter substrate-binding protein n=1 Tax=Streptomyces sp. NPDC051130 TaxID=3157223 RepID=UPI00342340FC